MSAPGPPGPGPRFPISDPSAPLPRQQLQRPPLTRGPFLGDYPRRPGPPFPNFGPPPSFRGPVRPPGAPLPPPGAAPLQAPPPQRGPTAPQGPFPPPNGGHPQRGPPPPSFRGPPFAGQPPPGQLSTMQGGPGQLAPMQGGPGQLAPMQGGTGQLAPMQGPRPGAVGPNQFQRPLQTPGAGPGNGPPMQRPPAGPFGQQTVAPTGGQFGQPPQAPPGTLRPPLMSPPPQQAPLQPPRGPPPSNQPRPGPPPSAPPQRPPPQQQMSLTPRPFPPGMPPNFRPPGWAPPLQRGPVPQQGASPQGFPPGGRPPMQWPTGPPLGIRPGNSAPPNVASQQQGIPPTAAQGGPPVLGVPSGGQVSLGAEGGAGQQKGIERKEEQGSPALGEPVPEKSEEVRKAWSAHKNDEGVAYYYNSATGKSTYEKPEGFEGEEKEIVPVAWERIEGTEWHLVTTNQDSKYYYNTDTQETSWQVPAAVAEQRQKQAEASAAGEKLDGISAVGAVKKKLHEEEANAEVGTKAPVEPDAKNTEQRNGHEQKSSEKEQRAAAFKDMLKEKKVPPFAKWDKELPKIFADLRFKSIATTAERRALFDRYVKTRAEEERLEKREALRAAMGGFRELLDEAAEELDHTVTYADFETMKGEDARFQALEKRERETLLNERIAPLRKAEAERVQLEHEAAVTAFHELLAERGVNESIKWVKIKEELREDPRYEAVSRAEREQVFNDFLAKWNKPAEVEDKLKVHEREARKRKEREEEELERIRSKARQKDALDNFKQILAQRVKEADATWADWRRRIEKDAGEKEVTQVLDAKDQEQLFKDHVRTILDGCVREYKRLLAESLPEDTILDEDPDGRIPIDSWTAAKGLMREDPRFKRLPRAERELLYRQYTDDVRKRLNLPPAAASRSDKRPEKARHEGEPRREYREHRDKRMRR